MTARILVAAYSGARQRLTTVLRGHELIFADTLAEAHTALNGKPFGLVLVGTRFDDSRMFDFLRQVNATGTPANTRIVCFRGMMSVPAGDKAVVEGVSLACEALGAAGFHDFAPYPNDAEGNQAVRRIFESYLEEGNAA